MRPAWHVVLVWGICKKFPEDLEKMNLLSDLVPGSSLSKLQRDCDIFKLPKEERMTCQSFGRCSQRILKEAMRAHVCLLCVP